MEKTLLHKGSVKDVYEVDDSIVFDFSDRYSIFDWGKMPNLIENKGTSLCITGFAFFEWLQKPGTWNKTDIPEKTLYRSSALEEINKLKSSGLKHHAENLIDESGKKVMPGRATQFLKVQPIEVVSPKFADGKYDYSFYKDAPTDCLVPLEVIFRFGVPKGSSLIKRASNSKYMEKLGIEGEVTPGQSFTFPVVEFSTKLEQRDRYVTYEEAQKIAGLHDNEFRLLLNRTQVIAIKLQEFFQKFDVKLWDGKFEYAFWENEELSTRDIMLVDSIGPDELRLTYNGVQLSKEVLRQFYAKTEWISAVEKSKKLAKERKTRNWKKICKEELGIKPEPLQKEKIELVSQMYQTLCNAITKECWNKVIFKDSPDLDSLISQLKGKG